MVKTIEFPRLFIATCSFDLSDQPFIDLDGAVGAVAGDPVYCEDPDTAHAPAIGRMELIKTILRDGSSDLPMAKGSFAAVAWNDKEQMLFLTIDKLGIRPLYFAPLDRVLVFGTTIRSVIKIVGSQPGWSEQGLAEAIYLGGNNADRTPYKDLFCLTPGEQIVVQSPLRLARRRYFDLASTPARSAPQSLDAIIEDSFIRAIKRRSREARAYAFLSGGLDSRVIVDSLVGMGRTVETFGSAFPNSVDDVVSAEAAKRFGLTHTRHHRRPVDRIRHSVDRFAVYARENFPPMRGIEQKVMWSGDGGSVTLGHVYMTKESVDLAAGPITPEVALTLFPMLKRDRPSRHISLSMAKRFRELAIDGTMDELKRVAHARPDRRLFHYYMNLDQGRHLYAHFEDLDISEIEFHTPFFDADFASAISSLPIEPFLYHGAYNRWMNEFHLRSTKFYWQEYPGHIPSPHARPENATYQWATDWFSGSEVTSFYVGLIDRILADSSVRTGGLISPWLLRVCKMLNLVGQHRLDYETEFARRVLELYHPT